MTSTGGYRLGIDFGTSNTVAVLAGADGRVRPLLFDASPLLSSAVFAGRDGLLTGADAERAGLSTPAALELNPKRRIDDGTVWLGEADHAVEDLIAAVLARVGDEAVRVAGGPLAEVVLTHPAGWAARRLAILTSAADRAGLHQVGLLPEPVAAAAHYADVLGRDLDPGRCLVVYDLGAGTFDVAVVRRTAGGFDVVSADGLSDVGGLDIDAAVVGHARRTGGGGGGGEAWGRLDWPQTPADLQARHLLWQGARAAKEQLSRRPSAELRIPLAEADAHLSREDFETLARPLLDRTVAWTVRVLRDAGVPREDVAGVFLVGGSSRIPLAATLLHRALRIAPTALDLPELVVAEGSLHAPTVPAPAVPTVSAPTVPAVAVPTAAVPAVVVPAAVLPGAAADATAIAATTAREAPPAAPVETTTAHEAPLAAQVEALAVPATNQETSDALTAVDAPQVPDAVAPPARHPVAALATLAALAATLVVVAVIASLLSDDPKSPTNRAPNGFVAELAIGASPRDVAFSADDKVLAIAANETAELWDVGERHRIGPPLTGHGGGDYGGRVDGVAFSPDGDTFATASQDGTVRLWSVRQHAQRGEPLVNSPGRFPTDWRSSVTFNRDGSRLAAAGSRGAAVWDLASRTRIAAVEGGTWDATFNPAGDRIATGDMASVASMWQVPGGAQIGKSFAGHSKAENVSNNVFAVAFSPDAAMLATAGGDGTVRLWDVATQTQSGEPIPVAEANDVAFSADGKYLATAGDAGAQLWRVSDHQQVLGALDSSRNYGASKLSFSHDGRLLAVAESGGHNVLLWDVSKYTAVPATPTPSS